MVAKCFKTTTVDTISKTKAETKVSIQENKYPSIPRRDSKM